VNEYLQTFGALLARDIRVLRRNFGQFLIRTIMQPLLFVFVFAYVFPKIGQGFHGAAGGVSFSTVLVPGLLAIAINFQGIQAVALPLVQEFSVSKEIEDRVLAPVPVWVVGLEKITAGAIQSLMAAGVVFPIVYLVHAHGEAPKVHVSDPALFAFSLLFASFLAAAMGLFIGTVLDPRKVRGRRPAAHVPRLHLLPVGRAEPGAVAQGARALQPARVHDRGLADVADAGAAAHADLGVHARARRRLDRAHARLAADVPAARRNLTG
jgi:ABC-type transport system involved in cytochrome c biogenesis permease component